MSCNKVALTGFWPYCVRCVPATAPDTADEVIVSALRGAGLRVTSQRLVVHRALTELGRHATADEVLRQVGNRLPALSLPTVYAALDVLVRLHLVRRVDGTAGSALYDPRTDDHAHFRCSSCGAVIDVDATLDPEPLLAAARLAGLQPDQVAVTLAGHCGRCP
jgi:Fe2+ or Zn2+ uptake regulation protein